MIVPKRTAGLGRLLDPAPPVNYRFLPLYAYVGRGFQGLTQMGAAARTVVVPRRRRLGQGVLR